MVRDLRDRDFRDRMARWACGRGIVPLRESKFFLSRTKKNGANALDRNRATLSLPPW